MSVYFLLSELKNISRGLNLAIQKNWDNTTRVLPVKMFTSWTLTAKEATHLLKTKCDLQTKHISPHNQGEASCERFPKVTSLLLCPRSASAPASVRRMHGAAQEAQIRQGTGTATLHVLHAHSEFQLSMFFSDQSISAMSYAFVGQHLCGNIASAVRLNTL